MKNIGIMLSMENSMTKELFSGRKLFVFEYSIDPRWSSDMKVFIYEPIKNRGSGMIVGEFILGKYKELEKGIRFGAYHFIEEYCRNILKDSKLADYVADNIKIDMPNYYKGTILDFLLFDEALAFIQKTGEWPPYSLLANLKTREANKRLIEGCDNWLKKIGYYDHWGESYCNYAIEVKNIIKYDEPLIVSNFLKRNGQPFKNGTKNWSFVY